MLKKIRDIGIVLIIPVLYFSLYYFSKKAGDGNKYNSTDENNNISTNIIYNNFDTTDEFQKLKSLSESKRIDYDIPDYVKDPALTNGFYFTNVYDKNLTVNDGNRRVIYLRKNENKPGYVCSGLNKNYFNDKVNNINDLFYLLPVVKIKSDNEDDTTLVFGIEITGTSGEQLYKYNVRVYNFKKRDILLNNYSKYLYVGDHTLNFCYKTDENNSEKIKGKKRIQDKIGDIKIYWYGLVDFAIEKVIVEDNYAYNLFSSDSTGTYDVIIDKILRDKTTGEKIKNYLSGNNFNELQKQSSDYIRKKYLGIYK